MFNRKLVKLVFKVTLEEKEIIEKAMSVIRGNFGSESCLEAEKGKALVMMAKLVLLEYKSPR
jgi:hypothetical protein